MMIEYLGGIAIVGAIIAGSGVFWARWDKKKEDERVAEAFAELERMKAESAKRFAAEKRKVAKKRNAEAVAQDVRLSEPDPFSGYNTQAHNNGGLHVSTDNDYPHAGPGMWGRRGGER